MCACSAVSVLCAALTERRAFARDICLRTNIIINLLFDINNFALLLQTQLMTPLSVYCMYTSSLFFMIELFHKVNYNLHLFSIT